MMTFMLVTLGGTVSYCSPKHVNEIHCLVPRPHPLQGKRGLVNNDAILGPGTSQSDRSSVKVM